MKKTDYELPGAFYLGREVEPEAMQDTPRPLLYPSRDLTTHGVVVGMTGSGKTGLSIGLLEEAAIDGIPVLAIDPKGDLANLALTFPDLAAEEFAPWVDPAEASRQGRTVDEHAAAEASKWAAGLDQWGQDASRVAMLKRAAEVRVYTPGSSTGRPLRVLRSFAAPPPAIADDPDALRERILGAVSSLLALLGLDTDPVASREHVYLSALLDHTWSRGEDLDLAGLVRAVQSPPFDRLGVLDLESVFPARDRGALAMRLNNLLASPGFAAWMEGEPLDVQSLLYAPDGRPRISVLSIAHLGDEERMFLVTTLLHEVLGWVRSQRGTSSLRALLFMDEVLGFFPPVANPPSKAPMLALLKQARAFGLGVLLATQNPVDLDYKGLSNAGSWFLGRLRTARDRARVLDGLEAAGADTDRAQLDEMLANLPGRTFLLAQAGQPAPALFRTRWVLSYLRGPMTRDELKRLTADEGDDAPAPAAAAAPRAAAPPPTPADPAPAPADEPAPRPMVEPEINEFFMPASQPGPAGARLVYTPRLFGEMELHFADSRRKLDAWRTAWVMAPTPARAPRDPWASGFTNMGKAPPLGTGPEDPAEFEALAAAAGRAKTWKGWEKALKDHVYKSSTLTLSQAPSLGLTADPDEGVAGFQVRMREAAREERDRAIDKLRKKYEKTFDRLENKLAKAREKVDREGTDVQTAAATGAVDLGTTLLGALFGGKRRTSALRTVVRSAGRTVRAKGDVERARAQLERAQEDLLEAEARLREETEEIQDRFDPDNIEVKRTEVRARKGDLRVLRLGLVWEPRWVRG